MKIKNELKQLLMKKLIKFRNSISESELLYVLFIVLKFLPIIFISHEWKVLKTGNMRYIYYLFISSYIRDNSPLISAFFAISLLTTIAPCLSLVLILPRLANGKIYKKAFAFILNLLYLSCFVLVQYVYEVLSLFGLIDVWGSFKIELVFCIILTILLAVINIAMVLIVYKPYFILPYNYIGLLDSYNFKWVIFGLLQMFIPMETYLPFNVVLYCKIILRVIFMVYYLYYLYNNYQIRKYTELFLLSFCFISCVFEFGVLHKFFNLDVTIFDTDPLSVTMFYDTKVFILKLTIQLMLSSVVVFYLKNRRNKREIGLFNFNRGKRGIYFCYFNKIYSLLYRIKEQNYNNIEEILTIYNQMINHHARCMYEDCFCRHFINKYNNIMDGEESNNKLRKLYKLILTEIELIISSNLQKAKETDVFDTFQLLLVDTLYNLYFKKHFAKSFFNIQQIENLSIYRTNGLIQIQMLFLKYEIIFTFIEYYDKTNNKQFKSMNLNYKRCNYYWKIEASIVNCLLSYKSIIHKFFDKVIKYDEYHDSLTKFYSELVKNEKLISKGLSRNFDENIYMSLKFLYFNNFFDNKKYLELKDQYLKNPQSLLGSLQTKSNLENMIIRHTRDKDFIIEYLSPNFSEYLNYNTNDIAGKELHDLMPGGFKDVHYNHVRGYIANNKMTVTDKEIFFLDSAGYMVMFNISGSVLLTIEEEFYIFCQLQCLSDFFLQNNIAFLCCDERGFIRHLDKRFEEIFVYKNALLNLVPVNFFTEIIERNRNDIEKRLKNEIWTFESTYGKLMQKIAAIDYDKLWDYDNISHIQFTEEFKLERMKYPLDTKLEIVLEKRSLSDTSSIPRQTLCFYVIKIIIKSNQGNSITQKRAEYASMVNYYTKISNYDDNDYIRVMFPKVKYYSLKALDHAEDSLVIRYDEINNINNETVQNSLRKKKYKNLFKSHNVEFNLTVLILGLVFFLSCYCLVAYYKGHITTQMSSLIYLDQSLFYLNNYLYVAASLTIQIFLNSDRQQLYRDYLIDISTLYLNSQKQYEKYYHILDDDIVSSIKPIFTDDLVIKYLDLDWKVKSQTTRLDTVIDNWFIKFRRMGNETTNIDNSKYPTPLSVYSTIPNYIDQNVVFIIENVVPVVTDKLEALFDKSGDVIGDYVRNTKSVSLICLIILSVLLLVFIIYQGFIYKRIQHILYIRFFTTHNIIKLHHFYLFKKVQMFEQLMKDFTLENFKKAKNVNIIDYTASSLTHEVDTSNVKKENDVYTNTFGKYNIPAIKVRSTKTFNINFANSLYKYGNNQSAVRNTQIGTAKDGTNATINNKTIAPLINNSSNMTLQLGKKEDDKNDFVINKGLFQTNTKISKYVFLLLIVSLVILITCLVLILKFIFGLDSLNHNYHFLKSVTYKNLYLRKLLLTYQVNMIKRIDLKDNSNSRLFEKYNLAYLSSEQTFSNLTNNYDNGFDTFVDFKNSIETSSFCSIISSTNITSIIPPEYLTNCNTMAGSINSKGYSIMLNQIYHLLYFLQDDLYYKLTNNVAFDVKQIYLDNRYTEIIEDSSSILFHIDEIFNFLLASYNVDSINWADTMQNTVLYLVLCEILIIFLTFLFVLKYSYSKSKDLIVKIEQVIANTISCRL
jgi:hypothetical protein